MSATSFRMSWLEAGIGWTTGGVMNGGDFSWEFIFDAVTQDGKAEDAEEEEAAGKSGRAIFREPGPRLRGVSEETLTRE